MKKTFLAALLLLIGVVCKAQYANQTLTLHNTTGCDLQVYIYAQSSTSGSTCTSLMWDLNAGPCASTFAYFVPASSTITISNYSITGGTFWYNGASVPPPAANTFYFTSISISEGFVGTGWTGCNPTYCQTYSGGIGVGTACSGYPSTYTVTSSPYCCGHSISWTDLGGAGTNATVSFNP